MIFNEIYSAYYNTVAKIITEILNGNTNENALRKIVSELAFGESMFTVLPSLKSEKWQLVRSDFTTPLRHRPTMPLTTLQKQWLKAILLDPRMRLFGIACSGLDGVEPLFTSEDYRIYDKYADGDPYEDAAYISHFRTILSALHAGQNIDVEILNRKGRSIRTVCVPKRLEYSEKDDKFRLIASGNGRAVTVNLARIVKCAVYDGEVNVRESTEQPRYEDLTLKVSEERNTLERCMLHFAHFEKRAEKTGNHYFLHIRYDQDDVSEMVIRVLSFGPKVEVIEPKSFQKKMAEKLRSQKNCKLF